MTTQTEALKLAQDVIQMLGAPSPLHFSKNEIIKWQKCNAAIKEALAQDALQALHDENERLGLYKDAYAQPEQEPVGYFNANSDGKWEQSDSNDGVPFYAALPPQPKEPEQEPVAVMELHTDGWDLVEGIDTDWLETLPFGTKLYTTPPQRKPLTDECERDCCGNTLRKVSEVCSRICPNGIKPK